MSGVVEVGWALEDFLDNAGSLVGGIVSNVFDALEAQRIERERKQEEARLKAQLDRLNYMLNNNLNNLNNEIKNQYKDAIQLSQKALSDFSANVNEESQMFVNHLKEFDKEIKKINSNLIEKVSISLNKIQLESNNKTNSISGLIDLYKVKLIDNSNLLETLKRYDINQKLPILEHKKTQILNFQTESYEALLAEYKILDLSQNLLITELLSIENEQLSKKFQFNALKSVLLEKVKGLYNYEIIHNDNKKVVLNVDEWNKGALTELEKELKELLSNIDDRFISDYEFPLLIKRLEEYEHKIYELKKNAVDKFLIDVNAKKLVVNVDNKLKNLGWKLSEKPIHNKPEYNLMYANSTGDSLEIKVFETGISSELFSNLPNANYRQEALSKHLFDDQIGVSIPDRHEKTADFVCKPPKKKIQKNSI